MERSGLVGFFANHRGDIVFAVGIALICTGVVLASQLSLGAALRDAAGGFWTTSDILIWPAVILLLIAFVAGIAWEQTYLPTIWAIAPLIPGLAAISVVATFLAAPEGRGVAAFVVGSEIAAAIVIIGAIPLRMLANVRVAQTRSYWELRRRSEQLRNRLDAIEPALSNPTTTQEMAVAEARKQLYEVRKALLKHPEMSQTSGLEWVSAMGYVSLKRRVDRAEEALFEVEPLQFLLGDALHDKLRLDGSMIKGNRMGAALGEAVTMISPEAYAKYFVGVIPPGGGMMGGTNGQALAAAGRGAASSVTHRPPAAPLFDDPVARAILREVRNSLNVYVEDLMEGIVRARNRLWRAILLTATTTFLLVGLAVLNGVAKPQLIAASVFFLVAAIVGLFNLLRIQGRADMATDDFNMFEARLVHTPLVSGLAGVAGVLLVAVAATTGSNATPLTDIFDLTKNHLGLLVAAAFGLAPDRIIGPLLNQTEQLKGQLQAGKAAVGTASATPAEPASDGAPA